MTACELTPELLLSAYAQGVFPMDVEGEIRWFLPDPRAILPLESFHASRNLRQLCRSGRFEVRTDTAFDAVIRACGDRPEGTWISEEIVAAYTALHRIGVAHSVEAFDGGALAGGLYGVALGGAFFGESMFHRQRDASKVALVSLVSQLRERGFALLDVQFITPHLKRSGAVEISCAAYLRRLASAVRRDCSWGGAGVL